MEKIQEPKTTVIMVIFGGRLDTSEKKSSELEEILDILWVKQNLIFQDFRAELFPILSVTLWQVSTG